MLNPRREKNVLAIPGERGKWQNSLLGVRGGVKRPLCVAGSFLSHLPVGFKSVAVGAMTRVGGDISIWLLVECFVSNP